MFDWQPSTQELIFAFDCLFYVFAFLISLFNYLRLFVILFLYFHLEFVYIQKFHC